LESNEGEFNQVENAVRNKKRDAKSKKNYYQSNLAHYVLKLELLRPEKPPSVQLLDCVIPIA
jgi:hypothetical protein